MNADGGVNGTVDADLDDADAARLWAASGAQWLTDPSVAVPVALVRRVVRLAGALDRRGARLAELVPAAGLGLLAERAALMGLPPAGRVSAGRASRLLRAADGWYAASLARDDDRELVPAWLEIDPPDADEIWDVVEREVALRPVEELSRRAALLGLPGGGVGEVVDGRPAVLDLLGAAPARPIAGAVVVDLSSLWAGPLCADILARLGARTINVESTQRPDGGRAARRFFAALHGSAESVVVDFAAESGRAELRRLLSDADMVIEGSRPRALEQLGIDAATMVREGPKVWISITARGRQPAGRDRVGFGDDAAAVGGLVGWAEGAPFFVADAVADPLTGLTAAYEAAEVLERDGRWLADVALSRVARSVADGRFAPPAGPAERPRARTDPGRPLPLGRDTDRVLGWAADANRPERRT